MNPWVFSGLLLIAATACAEPDPAKQAVARSGLPVLADAEGRLQLQATVSRSLPMEAAGRYALVSAVQASGEMPVARFALAGTRTQLGSGSCASLPDAVFANGFEN